jgi:hypothetical protein
VLYAIVLPIVDGFADRSAARAALIESYQDDERAVAGLATLRRAASLQRKDAAVFRLPGATPLAATDALKDRLATAVTGLGGDLRAVEEVVAPAGTIRVRTDARLTTAQLVKLLTQLQNSPPILVIETLTVTADQALQTGRAGPMDVRVEVSAAYSAAAPR